MRKNMGLVARSPVFGVSDQFSLNLTDNTKLIDKTMFTKSEIFYRFNC